DAKNKKLPPPPEVQVSEPVVQQVTDYEDFTGQTAAIPTVDLVAQVTGYLTEANFKEGMEVKKDTLLFVIDPRPYQHELERTKAMVRSAEASFGFKKAVLERTLSLIPKGGISPEELEKARGEKSEAEAAIASAKANVKTAELNLEWTRITAPFDGR